ncbi:MAG: F0F1 ATP synthase subunit epsilon [Bryobacteraceae bacterium]
MADTFELEIATPERLLLREDVSEAQIPAKNGYIGVLPGHAPLVSELTTGFMTYTVQGRKQYLSIHGGFVEVLPDHVRILAERAERAEEIDVQRAEAALQRAQERLTNPSVGVDVARALYAMKKAQARIEAAAKK